MIKRYEPCCPIVDEISMGDYVKYEDYELLAKLTEEAADELEAYAKDKYPLELHRYPSIKRGYDSDMQVVSRIRALLGPCA